MIPIKENKFQNKIYNVSCTLAPVFVYVHVHSTTKQHQK